MKTIHHRGPEAQRREDVDLPSPKRSSGFAQAGPRNKSGDDEGGRGAVLLSAVMAGLVPAIHVFLRRAAPFPFFLCASVPLWFNPAGKR